jgi:4-hydroxybenzoate polyprenyltransferase
VLIHGDVFPQNKNKHKNKKQMQDMALRMLVSCALLATFFYTPLLKAIPLVKNAVVAFVISQAIVAGGLAAGV